MTKEELYKAINELPEEKQKEVQDFVEFLKRKQGQTNATSEKKRQFGYAKGFFEMKEDFDQPLEDFKPYME